MSLEETKMWMNKYHDNWIMAHNKLNGTRSILLENKE